MHNALHLSTLIELKRYFLFIFLMGIHWIYAQSPTISIPAGNYIPGTCVSNASVELLASNGTAPYQYRIQSGPVGLSYPTSWQSSEVFNSLSVGTYVFEVIDANLESSTIQQIVASSYIEMNTFTTKQVADYIGSCATQNLDASVKDGSGLFTFELLDGGTTMYSLANIAYGSGAGASTITHGIFQNVAPGVYILKITDGCGEIRTLSEVTITSVDYKWSGISGNPTAGDNSVTDNNSKIMPSPFDESIESVHKRNDPYLFTCDSIAFRLSTSLTPSAPNTLERRFYVRNLNTNTIDFDLTYRPADYAPTGRPSIQLAINTPYRFYFDDLCNDLDSLDRNYNYSTGANFSIGAGLSRVGCGGYSMSLSKPVNWNFKERYSTPIDTLTVISSSVAGDTMVGKRIIANWIDLSQNEGGVAPVLQFIGVTPGATYEVEVQNGCYNYILSKKLPEAPTFDVGANSPAGSPCLLNTASVGLRGAPVAADVNGFVKLKILSGPTSFTDHQGITTNVTYPLIDSVEHENGVALGTGPNSFRYWRNLPVGTYTMQAISQCDEVSSVRTFEVKEEHVLKFDATIEEKARCGLNNIRVGFKITGAAQQGKGIRVTRAKFTNETSN